jgi:hypothetical protein
MAGVGSVGEGVNPAGENAAANQPQNDAEAAKAFGDALMGVGMGIINQGISDLQENMGD